ncbi:S-adenosyl-L-methionine-dependent methyltransferase [Hypoxylon crocopeplum]|nr:S-adenosyl-L-methionine-dependent methyltransferase [Hypoxylon crocopeplum]
MPRLPPSLIRRAHSISPHLATLLPACRDLASARNELRWIREHVSELPRHSPRRASEEKEIALLAKLCRRRGTGYPLQYILGSQPFGDLDIKCRPGVLIPRPETEAWVTHLAEIVRGSVALRNGNGNGNGEDKVKNLGILDLCTGSGCIALLLDSLLRPRFPGLNTKGFDIESRAVALARENLAFNAQRGLLQGPSSVSFENADVFSSDWLSVLQGEENTVDVLVSNPPYISAKGFACDTTRSVRIYEPKLALVPPPSVSSLSVVDVAPEDVFYARLLEVADMLRPRFAVFEVGDLAQGLRVAQMVRSRCDNVEVEIWRDWPDMRPCEGEPESVEVGGTDVPIRGSGNGRAVFIRRTI